MSKFLAVAAAAIVLIVALWAGGAFDIKNDATVSTGERAQRDSPMQASGESPSEAGASLEGREPQAPDEHALRGPVTVTLRGVDGRVLAGVPVTLVGPTQVERLVPNQATVRDRDTGEARDPGMRKLLVAELARRAVVLSDETGVAVFDDVPYDGSHHVGVMGANGTAGEIDDVPGEAEATGIFFNDDADGTHPRENLFDLNILDWILSHHAAARGPRVDLQVPLGLPLDVRIVRADTGKPLANAEYTRGPHFVADGDKPALPGDLVAVEVGQPALVTLRIRPPQGWVLVDQPAFNPWLHPRARALEVHVPLRREARVVVVPPADVDLSKPTTLHARVVHRSTEIAPRAVVLDGFGRALLRGIPHLQGELVDVYVAQKGRVLMGAAKMGADPDDEVRVQLTGPRAFEGKLLRAPPLLIGGRALPAKEAVRFIALDAFAGVPAESVAGSASEDSGTLSVRVLHPDGSPAAGAWVVLDETDDILTAGPDGRVAFRGVAPGRAHVYVGGGVIPMGSTAEITAGRTTELLLRTVVGGALDVTVVDEDGRPVPFATVNVHGATGADMTGTTQRIDRYTNHAGRRTFHGVTPGAERISARFGSRKGFVEAQVVSGKTTRVEIVLGRDVDK